MKRKKAPPKEKVKALPKKPATEKLSPFAFVDAVSSTKRNLLEEGTPESEYNPFMVNRALSYFPDTILIATCATRMAHMDKRVQFEFLLNVVRPRRRFSKWVKREAEPEIDAIMRFYMYNRRRAVEASRHLSAEQRAEILRLVGD